MVELIAPNGVRVLASDEDAPRLLANGYKQAGQPAPKRRRTTRKKTPDKS